jgi:GDP-L-fucose synthase
MQTLITGSSGLVGKSINIQNSLTPSSSQLNLLNYYQINEYLQNNKINCIIHLAANVGGLFKNMNHKVQMLEDNLLINFNLIKAAHNNNIQKIILCLSTCIFPDNIKYPINENDLHLGPPHFSNDAYAYAKRMAHIHAKIYNEQYKRQYISIIPTNIYGPNDNFHLDDAHVIPALIHKAYLAKKNNIPFIVKGTGKPLRQFIYSKDLGFLIRKIAELYDTTEPIILAPTEEYSIGYVAQIIADKFGIKMEYDTSGADGQYKKTADNSRLLEFIKKNNIDFQFTPIEKGLNETIEWFIKNYETARK